MVSHAPSTKREAPVILCDDASRQYQVRPIPGQMAFGVGDDDAFAVYIFQPKDK